VCIYKNFKKIQIKNRKIQKNHKVTCGTLLFIAVNDLNGVSKKDPIEKN